MYGQKEVCKKMSDKNNNSLIEMRAYAKKNVGPHVCLYTEWVLNEAQKRGIKRLYFLARDGYLLSKVANKIVGSRNLNIECRYLYCSRQALRTPSYHIIGEEAYDLLTLRGYYLTPRTVISRAMLGECEIDEIFNELGVVDADKPFVENEFDLFIKKLRNNQKYRDLVNSISASAYKDTIAYFKQEGLFENDCVAIVDSGWTGSMQRSLRQLMQNEGYCGKFYGFYFGMYVEPKSESDGEYLTYYFNAKSGFWNKLFFNNNLYECMLSAPHPMTTGYKKENGAIHPTYAPDHNSRLLPLIEQQIQGALEYVDEYLSSQSHRPDKLKNSQKKCYKILKRAMVYPTAKEVALLSNFEFCDDVTEGYRKSIADSKMKEKLASYAFFPRLFRKLRGKKNYGANEIFWVYGVIAYCPKILRPWYRFNVWLWEIAKIVLKK